MNWEIASLEELIQIVIATVITFALITVVVRIIGLRSFAKMSSNDFAATIAVGTILGDVILKDHSMLRVAVALFAILGFQFLFSLVRRKSNWAQNLLTNEPMLLMRDGEFLDKNLAKVNVSKSDIYGKLREANVIELSQVKAVVFESTGDISVLHGSGDTSISKELLDGVRS